jgi:hypothetical protein
MVPKGIISQFDSKFFQEIKRNSEVIANHFHWKSLPSQKIMNATQELEVGISTAQWGPMLISLVKLSDAFWFCWNHIESPIISGKSDETDSAVSALFADVDLPWLSASMICEVLSKHSITVHKKTLGMRLRRARKKGECGSFYIEKKIKNKPVFEYSPKHKLFKKIIKSYLR